MKSEKSLCSSWMHIWKATPVNAEGLWQVKCIVCHDDIAQKWAIEMYGLLFSTVTLSFKRRVPVLSSRFHKHFQQQFHRSSSKKQKPLDESLTLEVVKHVCHFVTDTTCTVSKLHQIWLVHANMVSKRSWKLLSSSFSSSRYKCEKSVGSEHFEVSSQLSSNIKQRLWGNVQVTETQ